MNIFITLFFAHFVGDYFFQPKSMAVKKGTSNLTALLHVGIYTFIILLSTLPYYYSECKYDFLLIKYYLWMVTIFIPHYIIDRFSLADSWLKFINGRNLEDFLYNGQENIPFKFNTDEYENYHCLRGGFTCIVYVVVDGISHLMCLWYGYNLIFN